jgi:hypothetical protein
LKLISLNCMMVICSKTVQGNKLYIAKSEHYVDDINAITLQSILDNPANG